MTTVNTNGGPLGISSNHCNCVLLEPLPILLRLAGRACSLAAFGSSEHFTVNDPCDGG